MQVSPVVRELNHLSSCLSMLGNPRRIADGRPMESGYHFLQKCLKIHCYRFRSALVRVVYRKVICRINLWLSRSGCSFFASLKLCREHPCWRHISPFSLPPTLNERACLQTLLSYQCRPLSVLHLLSPREFEQLLLRWPNLNSCLILCKSIGAWAWVC